MKTFVKGKKYTHQEYMELSIEEMIKSISEHVDKEDPKVGAVLVDKNGAYFDKAHRGELRAGDHGEFTLLERKYPNEDLSGFTLYTTLEPCVKRKAPKRGCYKRCINARLKKVYIGHYDPDPTVSGNGARLLEKAKIEVGYYDKKYEEIIAKENAQFFKEASKRAEEEKTKEIQPAINAIENELLEFQLDDLSEQAQNELINRMGLPYRFGTDGFTTYLNRMKLIKIDEEAQTARPTGLGLLLLGKSPEEHFPQARIKLTPRKDNNEPIIKDFSGALILLPQAIEDYFEAVFPKGFTSRKSFNRDENVEASSSGVYEVVMNAIVHRDYSIEGARIMIDINDEAIVVSSPGKPICTLEQLNSFTAPSFSRNPKIAHIFFEMGFVEERGFGMEELSKFQNYGLPKPVYTFENNTLKTTIYREIDPDKQTIIKSELSGINLLQQYRRLTTKQYQELTGLSERQSRNHLKALLDNDYAIKDGTAYVWKE